MELKNPYLKFKYDTKKMNVKPFIRVYPLVCWHIGAAQSDTHFINEHIKRIREDRNGVAVYMGDGGECVTRLSKGNIFKQVLDPQEQQNELIRLMRPLADTGKLLFGIRGNHGNRIDKESGLSFDESLCNALQIPYRGVHCFVNLQVNRSSYDLYFHHGTDSGVSMSSKVGAAEKFTRFIDVDAIFTAHSHVAMELMPALLRSMNNSACAVQDKMRKQYICGSAYDSRTGYAADKAYPPLTAAHIAVTFDGRINRFPVKAQSYQKFEASV